MARKSMLEGLLDVHVENADVGFELCVIWRPSESNPIACNHLRVNNRVLVVDHELRNSPQVFAIEPDSDGEFVVDWSIVPEVPLQGIIIAIINWKTKAKTTVGSKTALKRGAEWAGQQVVDAP